MAKAELAFYLKHRHEARLTRRAGTMQKTNIQSSIQKNLQLFLFRHSQ